MKLKDLSFEHNEMDMIITEDVMHYISEIKKKCCKKCRIHVKELTGM